MEPSFKGLLFLAIPPTEKPPYANSSTSFLERLDA